MKKAWIENEVIRDICHGNPDELYHPDVAAHYSTSVPDEAENGDGWVDGQLVKPEPPVPVAPTIPEVTYPKLSPVEFKLLFTSPERVAIKAARAGDPVIDDFYDILEDPRLKEVDLGLQSTQQGLQYLQVQGLLTAERVESILQGILV